jgi:lipid A disaccharide synthetase
VIRLIINEITVKKEALTTRVVIDRSIFEYKKKDKEKRKRKQKELLYICQPQIW